MNSGGTWRRSETRLLVMDDGVEGDGRMDESLENVATLLGDDEFLELMEAEQAAAGDDLDELTRQRLWRRLERTLPSVLEFDLAHKVQAATRQLWLGPATMVAMVLVTIGAFVL